MKLFVNSISVRIQKLSKEIKISNYDVIVNGGNKNIYVGMLLGDVLINDASIAQIDRMFKLMRKKRLLKLNSITFTVDDRESARHFVKSRFRIIKAGGGVVSKENMILMINRLNRWDLPKGKLDKDESSAQGAKREVEEECNIKVSIQGKICSTWHSYSLNGKNILKKTAWYAMSCDDDSAMKPQISEDIQAVEWKNQKALKEAIFTTYPSIQYVLKRYQSSNNATTESDKGENS